MVKKFVNIHAATGRDEYKKILKKIIKDAVCPFCEPHFLKYHTRPVLRKGAHWLVTENMNPYTGTKHHLLLVSRRHVSLPSKLSKEAWVELQTQVKWIEKKYTLPAGALFMRFGDTDYTGASVAHLHANILLGNKSGKGTEPLPVTLGFKKKGSPRA